MTKMNLDSTLASVGDGERLERLEARLHMLQNETEELHRLLANLLDEAKPLDLAGPA